MEDLLREMVIQVDQKQTIRDFKEKMLDFFELWIFRVEFDPEKF